MIEGKLHLIGRLTQASNATFLARDDAQQHWVYKPVVGERPLWDFPEGTLSRREVAAYQLSEDLGFDVVPLTFWHEGPLGPGSLQAWIDGEDTDLIDVLSPDAVDESWLPVVLGENEAGDDVVLAHRDHPSLRTICLFDLLINNSDRKGGHFIAADEQLYGVDHGVSLHVEDKVRTVLWGFAGDEFTPAERDQIQAATTLPSAPSTGLEPEEWEAVAERAHELLRAGSFPHPSGRWPAIPWPPW